MINWAPASMYSRVDLRHGLRIGEVELIEALLEAHAASVEHGAHGAIGQDHGLRKTFQQVAHVFHR